MRGVRFWNEGVWENDVIIAEPNERQDLDFWARAIMDCQLRLTQHIIHFF